MAARFTVGLLGPMRVEVGDKTVAIGGAKPRLLLARLALAAGEPVSVDALLDALWGEHPPATARKSLQKYVSELRQTLGAAALRTDPVGYALGAGSDAVDVAAFERLVERARGSAAAGQTRRAWELYEESLGLWRGPMLAGIDDAPALAAEARRLEEVRLAALEAQMEAGLGLGLHRTLVPVLEDLVGRHPLRERLWASLLTALYRSGRQADALAAYRRLRRTLREELGVDPSPELADLEERILLHDPALTAAPAEGLGNLPASFTSFVGREKEIAELTGRLAGSRLVTLTGPGGSGKTRLALELAAAVAADYPDGAWFADLSRLVDPAQVAPAVAEALGLAGESGLPIERVVLDFVARKRLLLLLDNCEHVLDGATSLVAGVLRASRAATLLATSRQPLGLTGEALYPVGPLTIPDETETELDRLLDIDAVRLFVDRAGAADPGFRLDAQLAPSISEICRRLDGIPLAVELAARQLHVLGPQQLRRGLLDQLDLLAAPGEPDARHRTMEAAIAWSHRLLDSAQREMFESLSVFPGTFTAEAVERVCGDAIGSRSAVPLLSALVSRSLVVRQQDKDGARYRLLEPIRAYAAQRAAAAGRTEGLRRAHAQWVLELFGEDVRIAGSKQRELLHRLSREHHHLRAALDWAFVGDPELALRIMIAPSAYVLASEYNSAWVEDAKRALDAGTDIPEELRAAALAGGAFLLAEDLGDNDTARSWAEDALKLGDERGDASVTAAAMLALGWVEHNTGALDAAEAHVRRALASFQQQRDPRWAATAHHSLAIVLLSRGSYDQAIEACRAAIAVWEELGSDWGAAKAWWLMTAAAGFKGDYAEAEACAVRSQALFEGYPDRAGQLVHLRAAQADAARLSGHHDRAAAMYRECLRSFQELGDRRCTASTLKNLGMVALHVERREEAAALLVAAMRRREQLGDVAGVVECVEGLGLVAGGGGRPDAATMLLAAADRLRTDIGSTPPVPERADIDAAIATARVALRDELFASAWDRGRALAREDLAARAAGVLDGLAAESA